MNVTRFPPSRDRAGPIIHYGFMARKRLALQTSRQKCFNFPKQSEKGMAFDAVRMNERRERDREREREGRSKRANERATMMGLSGRASERGE